MLLEIVNDTIDELTISKIKREILDDFKVMRNTILPNNVDMSVLKAEYIRLLQRTYEYCSHDAYIMFLIMVKLKDIFGVYGRSRITCMSTMSILRNA